MKFNINDMVWTLDGGIKYVGVVSSINITVSGNYYNVTFFTGTTKLCEESQLGKATVTYTPIG